MCRCPAAKTRLQCGSAKCCWRCGVVVWAWFRQQISFGSPTSPSSKVPSISRATRLCRSVTGKSNWSSFTKTSVSRFSPSEGFVAGALKRGRPPSRLLPSSSSAAPPRITQWPNWLSFPRTDFPRIIWDYRALREPQPGVNTEIFLNAQLQLAAVSLLSIVNMKLF